MSVTLSKKKTNSVFDCILSAQMHLLVSETYLRNLHRIISFEIDTIVTDGENAFSLYFMCSVMLLTFVLHCFYLIIFKPNC